MINEYDNDDSHSRFYRSPSWPAMQARHSNQLQVETDDKSLKKIIFKWSNSVGLLMILIYSLGKTCQIFGKLYIEKLSSLTTVNVNK